MVNKLKGRIAFLLVAVIIVGVASAGMSSFIVAKFILPKDAARAGRQEKVTENDLKPFLYPMGDFTVNLSEPGHYLKVNIVLEIAPKLRGTSDVKEHERSGDKHHASAANHIRSELKQKNAILRDAIIEELSRSSFRALLTPAGKRELRQRLLDAVGKHIVTAEVKSVYFVNFLAQ